VGQLLVKDPNEPVKTDSGGGCCGGGDTSPEMKTLELVPKLNEILAEIVTELGAAKKPIWSADA